jgi:hypothetical protein
VVDVPNFQRQEFLGGCMTKTLTTEILKAYAEKFRKDSARWAETGEPEKAMELNAVAAEFDGLAANREAQPVAWTDREELAFRNDMACMWTKGMGINEVPLYTAPPAPVVNPEFTGATAVPDFKALAENLVENLVDCGGADEEAVEQYLAFAEKTCRAAMLAQPVSQGKLPEGFKLMPIEITDEIAEAIAMEARCCGGIALCIYEAALAAAPECN